MNIRQHIASITSVIIFIAGLIWLYNDSVYDLWPGILLVIAGSSIIEDLIKGEWVDALVAAFIFGGLFAWFTGRITAPAEMALPLGLIGVGLILLLNIFRRTKRRKVKRKNKREIVPDFYEPQLVDDDDILNLDDLGQEKSKRQQFDG